MKINTGVYFFGYFIQGLLMTFFNTYLPVLLVTVLNADPVQIAIAQIMSYCAFFVRPLIDYISDKTQDRDEKKIPRKLFIVIGGFGVVISYVVMAGMIQFVLLLGLFWTLNYFCMSIADVAVDGHIVDSSKDIRSRDRKIVCTQIGNLLGSSLSSVFYLVFISSIYNLGDWSLLFVINSIALIPLPALAIFMSRNGQAIEITSEEIPKKESSDVNKIDLSNYRAAFLLMSFFLLLFFSEALVQVPYEPWLVQHYGEAAFDTYSLLMIFGPFIYAIGYGLKTTVLKNSNRKKVLLCTIPIFGVFDILIPFMPFGVLLVSYIIAILAYSIAYICVFSFMMEFTKGERSNKFQLLAVVVFTSKLIFAPVGTLISGVIGIENTGFLLILTGVLLLCSIIPLSIMKME